MTFIRLPWAPATILNKAGSTDVAQGGLPATSIPTAARQGIPIRWAGLFLATLLSFLWLPQSVAVGKTSGLEQQRSLFQQARKALDKKRIGEFRRLSRKLVDYPLYPYLVYWELTRRIATVKPDEAQRFLDRYADTSLAERFRAQWLSAQYRRGRWRSYVKLYRDNGDATRECRYRDSLYRLGRREEALRGVEDLWLVGKSQPSACDRVFKFWRESGALTEALVWARVRLAMERGNASLARYLGRFLDAADRDWVEIWYQVHRKPHKLGKYRKLNRDSAHAREIVVHGIRRWARKDVDKAMAAWEKYRNRLSFSDKQVGAVQRAIGLALARELRPEASVYLAALPADQVDDTVAEWALRAALANGKWKSVLAWLGYLDWKQSDEDAWRYWRARALEATGYQHEAGKLYAGLSTSRSYYGFLAADRIGVPYQLNDEPVRVGGRELAEVEAMPSAQRARELFMLGYKVDARREWRHLARKLDTNQLKAAAKLAHQWNWHDRAILTLGQAEAYDDLSIRFPLAHKSRVTRQAKKRNIDPAWVYGVVRQESAFWEDARSPAGAVGLMQIMPRTGRLIARQMKTRWRGSRQLLKPDTNIRYGVFYLRKVLDDLDENPVLATAAYNAGIYRVRSWLPEDKTMPADIWVELIRFKETRDYVKRVFAYTVIYEHRMGLQPTRLAERMRPVAGRAIQARSGAAGKG